MPRLVVLDAMGLAYRAYWAFVRRPLRTSGAKAASTATVRYRDIEAAEAQGFPFSTSSNGVIELQDEKGNVRERVTVPFGAHLLVEDGRAVPAGQPLFAENTSAIFGFANIVLKIRREETPDYWALAWDGPGPTFRHERFPDYKATRRPMPEDLLSQIGPIEDLARALGLHVLEVPGAEADDVMATLARRGERDGLEVILVTSDKDMLQLVDERVQLLSPAGKGEEYVRVDPAAVRAKWGVPPEQVRDVLALMGDSSDNVPGVPGVGEKTAVDLIVQFRSLERLYERLDEVKRPALREKLATHREQAFLSRELVTVKTDCDLPYGWEDLRRGPIRRDALLALARRYELARLERVAEAEGVADGDAGAAPVSRSAERRGTAAETPAPGVKLTEGPPRRAGRPPRAEAGAPEGTAAAVPAAGEPAASAPAGQGSLDLWSSPAAHAAPSNLKPAGDLVAQVKAVRERATHGLAVVPLAEPGHPRRARLVGLGLAAKDGSAVYVPLAHDAGPNAPDGALRDWLGAVLADAAVPKLGEDLKRDAHVLEPYGVSLAGDLLDVHVLSSLCDPERDHGLPALARDFLEVSLPLPGGAEGAAEARRARKSPAALPADEGVALARAAALLFPLADALRAQLEARDQWTLYETIERPLIAVLFDMERAGICLDVATLARMSEKAGEEIGALRRQLLELAGEEVNFESGPQVAKVLFEKLKLKPRGRTPGGALSTRQDVLEELAADHPFPARLLDYRALTKLKSTYLDALREEVDPRDGRVHTCFDQAGAATGRLSSSNPNLQNIPMRTEQGRAVRRAFVAPPGWKLVGADYSQIELRVMAHLSGDANLREAFRSGEDVHARTARRVFGVKEGSVAPELRARAKVVNFGVMYGMGAKSLAQQMGIPPSEAATFIADYFRVHEGVKRYLEGTVRDAREKGFTLTLLGRRRYLPGLHHEGGFQRSLAERAAVNTPIQGSAADLMKLAMIRVAAALRREGRSARLLLQVHDELLLECPDREVDEVREQVRREMEEVWPLEVPLAVSLGVGENWLDVH